MNKKLVLVAIIVMVLFVFLFRICTIRKVEKIHSAAQMEFNLDSDSYSKRILPDYAKLFRSDEELVINRTDESKRRNPISEYFYKNKFYVQVYKIGTLVDAPIDKIINDDFVSTEVLFNTDYIQFENDIPFMINYKLEAKPPNISFIYFTLFGENTKVLKKNQNIAYYYSNFENFSISYNQKESKDIYGSMKESFKNKKIPTEIMFIEQDKNLYYIVLAARDSNIDLDPNLLYNLVNTES